MDILTRLPPELQLRVCGYIDGESLLSACCVCRSWNRAISSMRSLWRARCQRSGFTSTSVPDGKARYVAGLRTLRRHVRKGTAFVHRFVNTTHSHDHKVDNFVYCEGYIFASSNCAVSVWDAGSGELTTQFATTREIICIHACSATTLAAGHGGGAATVWSVQRTRIVKTLEVDARMEVKFVAVDTEIGILVTARADTRPARRGYDACVRMWCVRDGSLLHDIHTGLWPADIHQVTLLRADGAVNAHTLVEGQQHSLLVKFASQPPGRAVVALFSWTGSAQGRCRHGQLSPMNCQVVKVWAERTAGCARSCHVVRGRLTYAPSDRGDAVVVYDLVTHEEVAEVRVGLRVHDVVAAGTRYAVVEGQCELVVVDLVRREIVTSWPLKYERFVTGIVCGNNSWLNSLENRQLDMLVLAIHSGWGGARDGFQTICWRS